MKIFLHIGVDKCGSTGIQSGLFRNRGKLKEAGIVVPSLSFSESHGHGVLFQELFGQQSQRHLEARLEEANIAAQLLSKELQIQGSNNVDSMILTWEGLNFLVKKDIATFAKILAGHSVTLIVYIREQAAIAQSGALQNIKVPFHGCRPINSIRNDLNFQPGINRNYFALLKSWKKLLNPDEIVVRRYDRNSLIRGDAFTDLLSVITNINPEEFDLSVGSVERNTSIDVPSALVLDAATPYIGRGSQKYYFLADLLLKEIEKKGKSLKYFLRESQVDNIRSHYQKANKKLASIYFKSDSPLFNSETSPVCSNADYSRAKYEAAKKLRSVVARCDKLDIDCQKIALELESSA